MLKRKICSRNLFSPPEYHKHARRLYVECVHVNICIIYAYIHKRIHIELTACVQAPGYHQHAQKYICMSMCT